MTSFAVIADAITTRAWHDLTSDPNPRDAASALGEAARLLETLGRDPLGPGPGLGRPDRLARLRSADVLVLAGACRRAAAGPATSGRLSDLMAAGADLVATLAPPPTAAVRWAFTVAALDPILACTAVLREHSTDPAAIEVDSRLTRVRTLGEAAPPDPRDAARLDQTRPSTEPLSRTGQPRPDRLIADLAYRAATTTDLSHVDARMLAAAGLHVAVYARPIVTALTAASPGPPDGRTVDACDAMVARWFGVRAALRTTPDSTQQSGSRRRSPTWRPS